MKRERLHAWLMTHCPAYKMLNANRQQMLVDEALAEERAHVRSERKKHLALICGSVVLGVLLIPFTGQMPIGSVLLGLVFMGAGVSHYRVASRIELRVREAARREASRLAAEQTERA